MDLKEKLKEIMKSEFGITTDTQLNETFEQLDWSEFGIFTAGGEKKHEN